MRLNMINGGLPQVYNIFCIILFLFLQGCSKREDVKYYVDERGNIIIEKYEAGKVKQQISYLPDTVTREGKAVYYQDGIITKIEHWNNGKLTGSHIEYANNNPVLFICHDSYGDTVFLRKFSGRKILTEEGNILPHGVLETDHLNNDSTLRYVSFIVYPPYVNVRFKSYVLNLINGDTINPIKTVKMYDWVHYNFFRLKEKGSYKYRQVMYLTDSLNNMLTLRIVDTAMFSFPTKDLTDK